MSTFRGSVYHAGFDELILHKVDGTSRFRGQRSTKGRHRDRVWPALSRYKNQRQIKLWSPFSAYSTPRTTRLSKALRQASLLTVRRRWMPLNPLEAWHVKRCDQAQRPSRYDPVNNP